MLGTIGQGDLVCEVSGEEQRLLLAIGVLTICVILWQIIWLHYALVLRTCPEAKLKSNRLIWQRKFEDSWFGVESVARLLLLGKSTLKKSMWGKDKGWFEEQNIGKVSIAVQSWAEKAVQ